MPDVTGLDSPLRNFRAYTEQGDPSDNLHDKVLLEVAGRPARQSGAPADARPL